MRSLQDKRSGDARNFKKKLFKINYENREKSVAYFSHVATFLLFTERQNQREEGHGTMLPLNTLLDKRISFLRFCNWTCGRSPEFFTCFE